jgi:aminobenzoyl-glutamate utilization protein B
LVLGAELAAKTIASTAIDIYKDESLIVAAKAELQRRVGKDFEYKALLGDRLPPLDYRIN